MNIRKYKDYSVEDFLEDKDFQRWVKTPNKNNRLFWEHYITRYPEQKETIFRARVLLLEMKHYFGQSAKDASEIQTHLQEVLEFSERDQAEISIQGKKSSWRKPHIWAIAASLLLLLGLFSWIWINQEYGKQHFATGYGEWKTVDLPDGSLVKLNANSELIVKRKWAPGNDRQVWLKGEAFFEVKKKIVSGAKFQVVTEDLKVEVLGTSFNVNKRGQRTEVFLSEGSIRLELPGHQEKWLNPGDFIAYSGEDKAILEQRKEVEPDTHTSWKDGVLILKDRLGAEIFKKIEEIYGVKVQVENTEILREVKAVSLPMDKLEVSIPLLEGNFNVEITREGNLLIVK